MLTVITQRFFQLKSSYHISMLILLYRTRIFVVQCTQVFNTLLLWHFISFEWLLLLESLHHVCNVPEASVSWWWWHLSFHIFTKCYDNVHNSISRSLKNHVVLIMSISIMFWKQWMMLLWWVFWYNPIVVSHMSVFTVFSNLFYWRSL